MLKSATVTLLMACLAPCAMGNGPYDISPDGLDQGWEPGDYGIETCALQKEIVNFSVERLPIGTCPGQCQAYKICLQLDILKSSIIDKFPGKTSLNKVCVKDVDLCTPKSFSDYNFLWADTQVGLAKGWDLKHDPDAPTTSEFVQCQIVPAGQFAEFELADGGRCLPSNSTWKDEAFVDLSVSNENDVPLVAECHSRPGWYQKLLAEGVDKQHANLGSCDCAECTLPKEQCIWRIQAPKCCDCGCDCIAEGECKNDLDRLHAGKYKLEVDLQKCTSPDDVANYVNSQGDYGCAPSSIPGCRTIKCETFVPPEKYQIYDPCSLEQF